MGDEGVSYHFSKSDLNDSDCVRMLNLLKSFDEYSFDEYKSWSMDVLRDLTLLALIRLVWYTWRDETATDVL
jgi:hypothetical protein